MAQVQRCHHRAPHAHALVTRRHSHLLHFVPRHKLLHAAHVCQRRPASAQQQQYASAPCVGPAELSSWCVMSYMYCCRRHHFVPARHVSRLWGSSLSSAPSIAPAHLCRQWMKSYMFRCRIPWVLQALGLSVGSYNVTSQMWHIITATIESLQCSTLDHRWTKPCAASPPQPLPTSSAHPTWVAPGILGCSCICIAAAFPNSRLP